MANRSIVLISTDRLAVSRGRRATKSSHRPKNQTRARFNSAWINHGCQIKSDRVTSRRRQEEDSFTLEGIETLGGHCWAVRTQGVPPSTPDPAGWTRHRQMWGGVTRSVTRWDSMHRKKKMSALTADCVFVSIRCLSEQRRVNLQPGYKNTGCFLVWNNENTLFKAVCGTTGHRLHEL